MKFLCCFLVSLTCQLWGWEESKVFDGLSESYFGSVAACFDSPNASGQARSAFLFTPVPNALGGVHKAQVFQTIIPQVLIYVINPHPIRDGAMNKSPDDSMAQITGSIDGERLTGLFTSPLVRVLPSSNGIECRCPPCSEVPWAGKVCQGSRFPSQDASFGVVVQQPTKFLLWRNFFAIPSLSQYSTLSVSSHCVVLVIDDRAASETTSGSARFTFA